MRARVHALRASLRVAAGRATAGLAPAVALAVVVAPALGQPVEGRGGYWRDGETSGYYRAQILDPDRARVQIEWVASDPAAGAETVVASVTLADLGGGAWQLVNPELRPEGEVTLLQLSAHDPASDARRTLVVELGAPGRYRLRD